MKIGHAIPTPAGEKVWSTWGPGGVRNKNSSSTVLINFNFALSERSLAAARGEMKKGSKAITRGFENMLLSIYKAQL